MRTTSIYDARWRGWLAGWLFIAAICVTVAINYIVPAVQQLVLSPHIITLEYCVLFLLYIVFLFGLRDFAIRNGDNNFLKTTNTLIILNFIQIFFFIPLGAAQYFEPVFGTIALVAVIAILCVEGVVRIRLADNFQPYLASGFLVKRIIWSNRVAGWSLASVVLVLVGYFVSSLADFFMWRFLAVQLKVGSSSTMQD